MSLPNPEPAAGRTTVCPLPSPQAPPAHTRERPLEVGQLVGLLRQMPDTRPDAVAAARVALRSGEVDSAAAIAAAVRAIRLRS
ncbi:hypothetical protein HQ576_20855 [bacterium]|nr:hypothetical protein [bacterium]